jgi:N-acetyltransferase
MSLAPVTLIGSLVRLAPLLRSHSDALAQVGLFPELWRLQPRAIETVAGMQAYVDQALEDQARGVSLPFVIHRLADQAIVGSTRFMDIEPRHRRLEIGATWITPAGQRTGANIEAKLLLLAHAFDVLGMEKVVFKTEALNSQSRTAILAMGAVEEGLFRRHLIADGGRARDMVYYSILRAEWPGVRGRLESRLRRHG